jgi:hypothetical protein
VNWRTRERDLDLLVEVVEELGASIQRELTDPARA